MDDHHITMWCCVGAAWGRGRGEGHFLHQMLGSGASARASELLRAYENVEGLKKVMGLRYKQKAETLKLIQV